MLAGDGPPAAPRALQCEALKEEACHAPICTTGDRVQRVRLVTTHRPRREAHRGQVGYDGARAVGKLCNGRSCRSEH